MAEKKKKKYKKEGKKILAAGFYIHWAADCTKNNNTQAILQTFTKYLRLKKSQNIIKLIVWKFFFCFLCFY